MRKINYKRNVAVTKYNIWQCRFDLYTGAEGKSGRFTRLSELFYLSGLVGFRLLISFICLSKLG